MLGLDSVNRFIPVKYRNFFTIIIPESPKNSKLGYRVIATIMLSLESNGVYGTIRQSYVVQDGELAVTHPL